MIGRKYSLTGEFVAVLRPWSTLNVRGKKSSIFFHQNQSTSFVSLFFDESEGIR